MSYLPLLREFLEENKAFRQGKSFEAHICDIMILILSFASLGQMIMFYFW